MLVLTAILVVPLVASLLCLLARSRRVMEWLNVLAFATTLILGVRLVQQVLARNVVTEWKEFLYADALSAWMVLLISLVSLASAIYAVGYLRHDLATGHLTAGRFREYHVLTPLFVFAMFLAVLANNLGIMWVALEATALASVFLVALYNEKTSLEAAWKYIILGSVGLVLALLGTILTYASAAGLGTETLAGLNWSYLITVADRLDPNIIKLAFVFVLVGYGTKAGIAPMHTWLPDAHSEAPAPTSAMLSGVYIKVALYGLLRFYTLSIHCVGTEFSQHLLLGFGLLSMCVATPFILVQTNIKRLFAYHSVEHIGIICVGLGFYTPLAVLGAVLHIGYHALVKSTLFFAAGNIHQTYRSLEMPSLGSGLLKTMPGCSVLLALAVTAIAGIPPSGMFFTEFSIVAGGMGAGQILASIVFVAALVTVFAGLLNHAAHLLLGQAERVVSGPKTPRSGLAAMTLLIGVLAVVSVWLPRPLFQLIEQAARIIGGTP
jgi:hydrogenase-4 component F